MALSAIPLTVKILALVILCLTFGPSWYLVFLILFGVIDHAFHKKEKEKKEKEKNPLATSASASHCVVNIPPNASAHGTDVRPEASVLSMDNRADAPNPVADPPAPRADPRADPPALSVADDPTSAADVAPTPEVNALVADPADEPADDPASAADVALTPAVNALAGDPASAADVAPNPGVNAPADIPDLSADALAPAVNALVNARADALALAPVVDVAGKKRGKPESSSPSLALSGTKYDVFLNFKGPATLNGFTDCLYHSLLRAGFMVFRNDEELPGGVQIKPALIEAIKQSKICIVILSRDFASSQACLMELELMWQCRETYGQTIIPIFYGVSPMDVRHQAGDFGRSFNLHEIDGIDSSIIEAWKKVLQMIGGLTEYNMENKIGRHESELVKRVVEHVARLLKGEAQVVTDKLVGIDLHVQEMMRRLGVAYGEGQAVEVRGGEVRVVRIWGASGVGKTTLAKIVFNKIHKLFDASSFLEDISLQGVPFSRRKLIADLRMQKLAPLESSTEGIEEIANLCCNAKVLIVLDGADKDDQIRALAEKLTWFGPGSRIIVTTNKSEVLNALAVGAGGGPIVEEYQLQPLTYDDALQLFREHAFEGKFPEAVSKYDSLTRAIIEVIGRFPSDIVGHASFLRDNMNEYTWKTTLKLLRENPKNRQAAFRVSYAGGSELEISIEDNQLTHPI